jgi:hypothetical protein
MRCTWDTKTFRHLKISGKESRRQAGCALRIYQAPETLEIFPSVPDFKNLRDSPGMEEVMTKKVEFDAHKVVKRPAEVKFTTKDGKRVDFTAEKPTKVPVHVKFKADK